MLYSIDVTDIILTAITALHDVQSAQLLEGSSVDCVGNNNNYYNRLRTLGARIDHSSLGGRDDASCLWNVVMKTNACFGSFSQSSHRIMTRVSRSRVLYLDQATGGPRHFFFIRPVLRFQIASSRLSVVLWRLRKCFLSTTFYF